MFSLQSPFAAAHACQKPLTTNSTLDRSNNLSAGSIGGGNNANKCINNIVRVAPRPKNPSQSAGNSNVRQNHFANSASGSYRPNLFATDYFQQQQQQQTTRGNNDNGRNGGTNPGMNTLGSNAINFSAYQQPNYPQYAHTAPRNRSSSSGRGGGGGGVAGNDAAAGTAPRIANIPGAHKVINDQSGDKINSGASFMDQCSGGKSLLPNPFLISRAGQSKGKLPVSASTTGRQKHQQPQQQHPPVQEEGEGNKKFNSLKSSLAGLRKTPQLYYSMRLGEGQQGPQTTTTTGKSCKRHQSFNQTKSDNGGAFEEEQQQPSQGDYYYEGGEQQHSLYYEEQPLYENLTDSIQIHELSAGSVQVQGDQQPATLVINDQKQQQQQPKHHQKPLKQIHRHHHHHHQHHQNGEKMKKAHHKSCDMIERNSIYRSDSGISNSSYECITPVPAPRAANGELVAAVAGTAAGYEATGGGGGTASRKSKKKMPVYMNLACHLGAARETGGGTDCVDGGKQRPSAAVNTTANTNPAEVCVPNFNLIIND